METAGSKANVFLTVKIDENVKHDNHDEFELNENVKHEEKVLKLDENVMANELDLESILSDLGEFGKFQVFIYSLTILPILLISCFGLSYIFTAGQLEYRLVKSGIWFGSVMFHRLFRIIANLVHFNSKL